MAEKRKGLSGKPKHFSAAVSCRASLIRAGKLFVTLFYKKPHQDKFSHLKQWEREKIFNFELRACTQRQSPFLPQEEVYSICWKRDKVNSLGLAESHTHNKNLHRNQHQPSKQKLTDQDLTPKISYKNNPPQAWKKERDQTKSNDDNLVDDFFKILGYE